MIRYTASTLICVAILCGSYAAGNAAPDAAPIADALAADAGAAGTASDDDAPALDAGTALVNPADADPIGVGRDVYAAIKAGKWLVAVGGICLFLSRIVLLLIGYLKPSWAAAKIGRYVISGVTNLLVVAGVGLLAGVPISLGLIGGWLASALAAAGLLELATDAGILKPKKV